MANKHIKRWSTSSDISEMWIKTTMRYHCTSTRMAIITSIGEKMEKLEPSIHCWWDYKMVWSLWKTIWQFLKKLNTELPNDPAIPLLGGSENICPHRYSYMNVHNSITHTSPTLETIQISINWWMDKHTVVHPYNRILFSNKRSELIHVITRRA